MPTDPSRNPRFDLLPVLILAGVVLLALIAWRLFPLLEHWLAYQDCVATGRTNCSGIGR
ncbi:MAG: hypothetical protein FWD12_02635 [Alphaproteobacteria bacterium]|nr:hypothetical protein [Alphaproteobacteria bacterium]